MLLQAGAPVQPHEYRPFGLVHFLAVEGEALLVVVGELLSFVKLVELLEPLAVSIEDQVSSVCSPALVAKGWDPDTGAVVEYRGGSL